MVLASRGTSVKPSKLLPLHPMNAADLVGIVGLQEGGTLPELGFRPTVVNTVGWSTPYSSSVPYECCRCEPGQRCRIGGMPHTPAAWSGAPPALPYGRQPTLGNLWEPGQRCPIGGKRHTPAASSGARDALLRSSPAYLSQHRRLYHPNSSSLPSKIHGTELENKL